MKIVKPELRILPFKSSKDWSKWLVKNHSSSNGIWLKFFKKNSCIRSIVYSEAVDEALCYGWIDGQAKSFDDQAYLQRFTPRRTKSIWSKRNIENIKRLSDEDRMKPSGLKEVESAKTDGRWDQAYDSPSNAKVPDDFLKQLSKNKKSKAFFATLNKTNLYAITWRLQTAKKPKTRLKRMKIILEMLAEEKKFH